MFWGFETEVEAPGVDAFGTIVFAEFVEQKFVVRWMLVRLRGGTAGAAVVRVLLGDR